MDGVIVFHSGTESKKGKLIATGGRVLGITSRAQTIAEAQKLAYRAIKKIDWPDGYNRNDIGW